MVQNLSPDPDGDDADAETGTVEEQPEVAQRSAKRAERKREKAERRRHRRAQMEAQKEAQRRHRLAQMRALEETQLQRQHAPGDASRIPDNGQAPQALTEGRSPAEALPELYARLREAEQQAAEAAGRSQTLQADLRAQARDLTVQLEELGRKAAQATANAESAHRLREALKEAADLRHEQIQTEHSERVRSLEADHETQLEQIWSQHAERVGGLERDLETRTAELRAKLEATSGLLAEATAQVEALERARVEAEASASATLDQARREADARVTTLETELETKTEELRAKLEEVGDREADAIATAEAATRAQADAEKRIERLLAGKPSRADRKRMRKATPPG